MIDSADKAGISVRPHVKTHKNVEIALMQVGNDQSRGIVCSTVRELEYFAAAGFKDLLLACPLPIPKLPRIEALLSSGCLVSVLVDNVEHVRALEHHFRELNSRLRVFVKLDTGYHRAGVSMEAPDGVQLCASLVSSPVLQFYGVYSHSGVANCW